ncbi:Tom37 metaxin N-terminal-like domain-containing protein [Vibrio sp. WJH972]
MITLYGFGPNLNIIDPSPFVLKTHFLLKESKLEFDVKTGTKYLQKAPKGKLPFIEDNGKIIADSFFIERYLREERKFDINAHLTDEQSMASALMCSALEDRLYWCVVYFRWGYESNWRVIKDTFFQICHFL